MPQDAFTLRHIKNALSKKLTGGKISKINQPDKNEISLFIYTEKGTLKLEICTSAKNNRVNLARDEKTNPKVAPAFCMLLRKHLQNAEILAVEQVGFERIIYFDLKCFSEFSVTTLRLYCEIMGKYSNVVLTEKGVILGALKCTSLETNMKRVLFPGAKYTLPDPQDKVDPSNLAELEKLFERKVGDASDFIADNVAGIAYTTALEIAQKYGENLTAKELYNYIFSDETSPCITLDDDGFCDFKVRSESERKLEFDDLLSAQTEFYSVAQKNQNFSALKTKLSGAISSAIKKTEKRLAGILEKERECEKADEIKLWAELITANIYLIERGDRECNVINYYDENQPTIKIRLDERLTPAQNAQKYYKKYGKLKRTQENLTVQKAQTEEIAFYYNSIKSSIDLAETSDDLVGVQDELISLGLIKDTQEKGKKQKQIKTPFRTFEIDGFRVEVGRNNTQNDELVRSASANDLWLHAKKYHSAHAIIYCDGKSVSVDTIVKCAEICAFYSLGRSASKVAVDYTLKKYVKKPPKSNAGFVIYSEYKTVLVNPNAHTELKKED